jgi:uncharacterized membrane protein
MAKFTETKLMALLLLVVKLILLLSIVGMRTQAKSSGNCVHHTTAQSLHMEVCTWCKAVF